MATELVETSPLTPRHPTTAPNPTRPERVPRTLIVKIQDRSIRMNPFQIEESLSVFCPLDMFKHPNGNLEVLLADDQTATKLLKTQSIGVKLGNRTVSVPVSVTPHTTKNYSRGVISCRDLTDTPEEEILEGLRSQGVLAVKKLTSKREQRNQDTGTLLLTFSDPTLPDKVQVAWQSVRVRPYIPNPIRCFRCQAFGHMASNCKSAERCKRCGGTDHKSETCTAVKPKCAGCEGEHEAWDRACPRLKEAKDSLKRKVGVKTHETQTKHDPGSYPTCTLPRRAREQP